MSVHLIPQKINLGSLLRGLRNTVQYYKLLDTRVASVYFYCCHKKNTSALFNLIQLKLQTSSQKIYLPNLYSLKFKIETPRLIGSYPKIFGNVRHKLEFF